MARMRQLRQNHHHYAGMHGAAKGRNRLGIMGVSMRNWFVFPVFLAALLPITAACGAAGTHQQAASKASAAGRPTPTPSISLPPGAEVTGPGTVRTGRLTEVFAGPLPPDPAEAKVMMDFREAMVLWNASQEKHAFVPPVTSYVTGSALAALKTTLTTYKKNGTVPSGRDRFFKTTVLALTSPTATITTCDDGSGDANVNPTTGAVGWSAMNDPVDQRYVYLTWGLTLRAGHWAIDSINSLMPPATAANQCLPGAH